MKHWQEIVLMFAGGVLAVVIAYICLCGKEGTMTDVVVAIIGLIGVIAVAIIGEFIGWRKVLGRLGEKSEKNLSQKYDDIMKMLRGNYGRVQEKLGTRDWDSRSLTVQHKDMLTNVNEMMKDKIGVFSNSNVAGELEKIQTALKEQKDRQREIENRRQLLTQDMSRIDVSVETLNAFREMMMQNQETLLEQQKEIGLLKSELRESQIEVEQLREMNQQLEAELAAQQDRPKQEHTIKEHTHHLSM